MSSAGKRAVWFFLAVLILAAILAAYTQHRSAKSGIEGERARAYAAAVERYSRALPLGTTRQDVEAYLTKSGMPLRRMCCMDSSRPGNKRVDDILTKVGVEKAPFYCSEHIVYVGFQFASSLANPKVDGIPSDRLERIRLFHSFEGCW